MKSHAECPRPETLYQDTHGQTFTYIAVIKLSCLIYWLHFEAYRQYSKRKFLCGSQPPLGLAGFRRQGAKQQL